MSSPLARVPRWFSLAAEGPWAARYGAALASLLAAVAIQRVLQPWIYPTPFLLFSLAVLFSSWFCGLVPSLLVLLGAEVAAAFLFLVPLKPAEALQAFRTPLALLGFAIVGLALIVSSSAARRAFRREVAASRRSEEIAAQQRASADRAGFLANASSELSDSLDYESTLRSVAQAAVPGFADWAAVDLLDGGELRRVAVAHVDPAKVQLGWDVFRRFPPRLDDPSGAPAVIRSGRSEFAADIPDALLAQSVPNPELLALIRKLGLRSGMVVPMGARGRTLGAISFLMAESGRRYQPEDLALAEELGRRAAVAVENARLYRESLEAARLKDEFLSTLSHELRTPLTAVLGWARILGSEPSDPERMRRGLASIERNAQAQAHLIEDLLDVSRIVTGNLRLDVRTFDPVDSVRAAIETVHPAAELKSVRLEIALDPAAGPINGDPARLQQIVWNLLNNAVKFTPKGGAVQVALRRMGAEVELRVADTGQGIDPSFLPFVFERFRQGNPSLSRAQGGLGLGLSIVRHLVELHGGAIEACSEGSGKGAAFVVRLPVALARPSTGAGAVERRPSRSAAAPAGGELAGLRVLVVEDSSDGREFVAHALRARGAEVVEASLGAEALEKLEAGRYDALVSDIGMPGMDGYELIARVRLLPPERNGRIPAAALTAYARSEDRARALRAGFDLHVAKPVEPDELVVAVASLARGRAAFA